MWKWIRTNAIVCAVVSGLLLYAVVSGLWLSKFGLSKLVVTEDPSIWGQFGDYLGGLVNPLLSVFALLGIAYGVDLNRKQVALLASQAEHELRAYVTVGNVAIEFLPAEIRAIIHYENFGQTPAYCVRVGACMWYGPTAIADHDVVDDVSKKMGVLLAPTQASRIHVNLEKAYDIVAIRQGEMQVFVNGRLEYTDVFGKTHFEVFRKIYGGPYNASPDGLMAENGGHSSKVL